MVSARQRRRASCPASLYPPNILPHSLKGCGRGRRRHRVHRASPYNLRPRRINDKKCYHRKLVKLFALLLKDFNENNSFTTGDCCQYAQYIKSLKNLLIRYKHNIKGMMVLFAKIFKH